MIVLICVGLYVEVVENGVSYFNIHGLIKLLTIKFHSVVTYLFITTVILLALLWDLIRKVY